MKTQEREAEFFATHPKVTECYEALGKVFAEKEKAEKYLGGVSGRLVTTHTPEGITFERESDSIKHQIANQNNLVNDKQLAYENAAPIDKQAMMGEWNAAKEVLRKMEDRLAKQLILEEKDELLAKEQKPVNNTPVKKELTVDELKAKVSARQAIVDTNEKLIAKTKDVKKKTAAEKVQKAEVKKLTELQDQLKVAEEKASLTPTLSTGGEAKAETPVVEVPAAEIPVVEVPVDEPSATEIGSDNNSGAVVTE